MKNEHLKVLIIDDEVIIAETIKDYLFQLGYGNVAMVHSKSEALHTLRTDMPDIVLLDIRMEGYYDGLELGKVILDELKIPFIYITAHSDLEMTKRILKTKPDGYITKPIRINDLMVNLAIIADRIQVAVPKRMVELKNGANVERFAMDELLYLKAEGNYIAVVLKGRKLLLRNTLEQSLKELNSEDLVRVHRSFVVNRQNVMKWSTSSVTLPFENLPVSRTYTGELKKLSF